ncbi:phospholipase C [Desulforamulus putei DSM 12395]|uniref:Phospholipase C n=2 Tax=Desulforamulus putei TaxID=74701 RepID=A0A1M4UMI9_9FIRM|nr:phospholipase C [Desulforamulus putei DSM 12395]
MNDGYKQAAQFFNMFADQLDSGVVWVDNGLQSACHLYDPDTKSGMWHWPSAAEKCVEFYHKALKLWHNKKHARAMFFLGAALHLVQDVCVPHHASCKIFNGHVDYESWVEIRRHHYLTEDGGIYQISDQPQDWITENAKLAKQYFSLVSQGLPEDYHRATAVLLPRAQQTTAGFLLHFYNQL